MKIFILDGCKTKNENVYNKINNYYKDSDITWFRVLDNSISYCTGCWSCWVKTPGRCVHRDDTHNMLTGIINSDLFINLTENSLGFMTSDSKRAIDKMVTLIHPYIDIVEDECHHLNRYDEFPKIGLIFIDKLSDVTDFDRLSKITSREALNFRTEHVFSVHVTDDKEDFNESLYI